jgi:uncharacterized protein with ParB-like and HNH nuclease domain
MLQRYYETIWTAVLRRKWRKCNYRLRNNNGSMRIYLGNGMKIFSEDMLQDIETSFIYHLLEEIIKES